jgi:uncharacterized membrane protein YbaN (DUF454 family)
MKKKARSILLITLGTLCVVLAGLGVFIPILPTTPFLLLAAYLYARSSERFLKWLLTNGLFGRFISNYRSGLGIPLLQKVLTIVALWATIGASIALFVDALWLRILLLVIAVGVTIHLVSVKTLKPQTKEKLANSAIINPCNEQEE